MRAPRLDRRAVTGAAAVTRLILLAILVAAAGFGAWWFLFNGQEQVSSIAPLISGEEAAGPASDVPVAEGVQGMSVDELFKQARKALAEQRMVAPAGNNALEFYLGILDKDPNNSGAKEALRELFPFATGNAEQAISQGDMNEATRVIDLLAKADSSNYTLTILRSKMDARRKQIEREQALAAAPVAAPAAAPTRPGGAPTAATSAPASESAPESAPVAAAPTETRPASPVSAPAETPEQRPAANVGETREARVLQQVAPTYPPTAARNRQEGWVEVEFTVSAGGEVTGARVINSEPARVFDREAIRAVERSKFSPRLRDGTPIDSVLRRRIEFKLGG